jgi:hypothetical protein
LFFDRQIGVVRDNIGPFAETNPQYIAVQPDIQDGWTIGFLSGPENVLDRARYYFSLYYFLLLVI